MPDHIDPKTGEMVLEWTHYDPVTETDVHFSRRFHPKDYVTDRQLTKDYHFTTKQRYALGGYDELSSRTYESGYIVTTPWWKRERVEAVMTSQSGYQSELF